MARKKKKKPAPTDQGETNRHEPTDEIVGSRRSFLWKLWLGLGGVALLEYAWLSADFLRPRKPRAGDEAGDIVIAGPIERFEPSTVTAFPLGKFYLARLGDGGLLAISRECTHLGCTVPWNSEEGRFVCPCHSSEYDITVHGQDRERDREGGHEGAAAADIIRRRSGSSVLSQARL
jgi:nitrite reductase/ring-hydroxylating ferredoxin subunit